MILWYYMRQVFAVKQNEMHITTIVIILFETLLNRMVFFFLQKSQEIRKTGGDYCAYEKQ